MNDSRQTVMDIIFGRWRSQILYTGVKLGIFDALSVGPKSSTDLAVELRLNPALTYRLLRALGSLGLLKEETDQTFSLTPAAELLRKDHPESLRGMTLLEEGPEHYAVWKHLPAMIQDGRQDGFVREFGHPLFVHAIEDSAYGAVFDEAMTSLSSGETAMVLEALATSRLLRDFPPVRCRWRTRTPALQLAHEAPRFERHGIRTPQRNRTQGPALGKQDERR